MKRACSIIWPIIGLLVCTAPWSGCDRKQTDYNSLVKDLGLSEVAGTFNEDKIQGIIGNSESDLPLEERQATALLASLGLAGNRDEIMRQWEGHPIMEQLDYPEKPNWIDYDSSNLKAFVESLIRPIETSITKGFNIIPESHWPAFDPDKTVVYGHNDWKHAQQVCALLYSEGLTPRLSAVQKVSAFLFHDDWGEPSRPLIPLQNGRRLVRGVEFDLFLEFDEKQEVERFAQLITRFAKKDSPDEPGLLHGSWWQPFYRTFAKTAYGKPLTVLLVSNHGFRANLISLPEDADGKLTELKAMDSSWTITPIPIWVNPAFYRFQTGDYK